MTGRSRRNSDHPLLTEGHLNRALLARQHLLARAALPVERMVERLAGLNALAGQASPPPRRRHGSCRSGTTCCSRTGTGPGCCPRSSGST